MRTKKGQMGTFQGLAVGIATLVVVLAVAFLVMSQTKDQIGSIQGVYSENCTNTSGAGGELISSACNATATLQNATQDIPGWIPLIVIVIIGGTILAMVSRFGR